MGPNGRSVGMYHQHLPMLERGDVIGWDRDQQQVRRGPNFDAVKPRPGWLADETDEDAEA